MPNNPADFRTRNFGPYGYAESKKTQKFVFRSALRPNQISFSHSQDPERTIGGQGCCDAEQGSFFNDVVGYDPLRRGAHAAARVHNAVRRGGNGVATRGTRATDRLNAS